MCISSRRTVGSLDVLEQLLSDLWRRISVSVQALWLSCSNWRQSGDLSLVGISRDTVLSLAEITMLLCQLSCVRKIQLKASKVIKEAFLAFRCVFMVIRLLQYHIPLCLSRTSIAPLCLKVEDIARGNPHSSGPATPSNVEVGFINNLTAQLKLCLQKVIDPTYNIWRNDVW